MFEIIISAGRYPGSLLLMVAFSAFSQWHSDTKEFETYSSGSARVSHPIPFYPSDLTLEATGPNAGAKLLIFWYFCPKLMR